MALMLFRVGPERSLRETEAYLSVVARGVGPADCLPRRSLSSENQLRLSV
jgi:hypothetical protein